jgi:hypothetical protein
VGKDPSAGVAAGRCLAEPISLCKKAKNQKKNELNDEEEEKIMLTTTNKATKVGT